jgi:hypothetical protein
MNTYTEYKESRAISNQLATLIRSGKATSEQAAEYERRDTEEHAFMLMQPRRPWFLGMTCDELGLMP